MILFRDQENDYSLTDWFTCFLKQNMEYNKLQEKKNLSLSLEVSIIAISLLKKKQQTVMIFFGYFKLNKFII